MAVDKLTILQNIGTSLAYITTANNFRTTVTTVEPTWRVWGEVADRLVPWLGYGDTEATNAQMYAGDQVEAKMTVSIVAHIFEASASAAQTAICGLEDDIMHVMCSSEIFATTGVPFTQRGVSGTPSLPNAIHTTWIRTTNNVPDVTISADGGVCMVMDFEVLWDRTSSRSPT